MHPRPRGLRVAGEPRTPPPSRSPNFALVAESRFDFGRSSRRADAPATPPSKVAVKVINHYGDEVMKVFGTG